MCRFYGFRGTVPAGVRYALVDAPNALVKQSRGDRQGRSHPDGWGVGYYHAGVPLVQRGTPPASEDDDFRSAAERIHSQTVIAHIRAASVGDLSLVNTHPFVHGCWLFAHNGTVTAFDQVAPTLQRETEPRLLAYRQGSTDSELVFFWLLTRLAAAGFDPEAPCGDLLRFVDVVGGCIAALDGRCASAEPPEPARLNVLLTDGNVLLASRWRHSLHWLLGPQALTVASEPLDDGDWQEVPDYSILVVEADLRMSLHTLTPPETPGP